MKAMGKPAVLRLAAGIAAAGCGVAAAAAAGHPAGQALLPAATAALAAAVLLRGLRPGASGAGDASRLEQMAEEVDHIMIGAAETSHFIDAIKRTVDQDLQATESIVERAARTAQGTEQIAQHAAHASGVAADVRSESVAGRAEADQGWRLIDEASQDAQTASAVMEDLQDKSRRIHGITETINGIAMRTNLLALNAAIEAARAGEHGRGFAVVAGEVRQLAQRTREATDDIGAMVREIAAQAELAAGGMTALAGKVQAAAHNVERVHRLLGSIETSAGASEAAVQQIADASRGHVDHTRRIADAVSRIRDGLFATHRELPRATQSAMLLSERGETLFGALAALCAPRTTRCARRRSRPRGPWAGCSSSPSPTAGSASRPCSTAATRPSRAPTRPSTPAPSTPIPTRCCPPSRRPSCRPCRESRMPARSTTAATSPPTTGSSRSR